MNRHEAQELASRVEVLLDAFHDSPDRLAADRAEELVRALVALYGAGLARVVDLVGEADGGEALVRRLAGDDLVGSLLVLHDLHPDDVDTRVQQALDRVRPYLGSHAGGIEYAGVDADGVAHLRLEGSCDGCPSSSVTVTTTIERAVLDAAPEVVAVDVQGVVARQKPLPVLQIGRPPSESAPAAGEAAEASGDGWAHLEIAVAAGHVARRVVGGLPVAVCVLHGTPYAYRDECATCGAPLSGAALDGEQLTCAACGSRYDVRLAGRSLSPEGRHLDPLPLLPEGGGWRVALPREAAV
jgi:Fe-S cluster biogenesis protein NfuA/nitrite reductase/ring-hydroxylating ferredoxin subunit